MRRLKPIVATTPEDLAAALGLSAAAAKEWQVQHELLKRLKEIVRRRKITHAEVARRAGTARTRVTAILNDDLEHVFERSSDPHSRLAWLPSENVGCQIRQRGMKRATRVDLLYRLAHAGITKPPSVERRIPR